MKVFSNHNGLRRNKMHLFIAPTGVGKSTFTRTMVIDFIRNNPDKKVLVWLTEETKEDFEQEMSHGLPLGLKYEDALHVISEQSLGEFDTAGTVKQAITEAMEYYKYDLIIYDNITTSKLYLSKSSDDQEAASAWLKMICKKDLALFIVAHTGGNISEDSSKLLDENDIRGNKTLPNMVEFLYILQPFYVKNTLFQFIVTKKSRGQQIHSKYIGVIYDPDTRTFNKDEFVPFEKLKEVFNKRNRLRDDK
jgi:KaiC/GvpD/RAD55 family RecA-like ATPase